MSVVFTPHEKAPRDLALAAIKEALGSVEHAEQRKLQFEEPYKKKEKGDLSEIPAPRQVNRLLRGELMPRRIVGVLALICIAVAILSWHSSGGQVSSEPISTSSVPIVKKEVLLTPLSLKSDPVAKRDVEPQLQAPSQSASATPTSVPPAPEQAYQIQGIARELANVVQGLDHLKSEQSQIVRENAELADGFKATDAIARRTAEFIEGLGVAQSQLAREINNLTDQLKANQDLMANLSVQFKETQEQVVRLANSEQKQRLRPFASLQPTAGNSPRQPTAANAVRRSSSKPSAEGGAQTQGQTRGQPKPQ
jgi:hypothetical protein